MSRGGRGGVGSATFQCNNMARPSAQNSIPFPLAPRSELRNSAIVRVKVGKVLNLSDDPQSFLEAAGACHDTALINIVYAGTDGANVAFPTARASHERKPDIGKSRFGTGNKLLGRHFERKK